MPLAAVDGRQISQRYWTLLLPKANAVSALHADANANQSDFCAAPTGVPGLSWRYVLYSAEIAVELYFSHSEAAENKRLFDELRQHQVEVDAAFGTFWGAGLRWMRLEEKKACRIEWRVDHGGFRSAVEDWRRLQDEQVEAMHRLVYALQPWMKRLS